jgi:hypothetical protein
LKDNNTIDALTVLRLIIKWLCSYLIGSMNAPQQAPAWGGAFRNDALALRTVTTTFCASQFKMRATESTDKTVARDILEAAAKNR